ncbi:MAG: TetR/AcrR family transcriptional regulator [Anaerolineae bacterium]
MEDQSTETQTRRDRRKERTHRRLLRVGERLFRTQGFDATTVEEIAQAADVAKGTFFNYFDSKEKLLGELLYLRIAPLLRHPPGEGEPAPERIWRLLTTVRDELGPYAHLFQRMFAYALSHPDSAKHSGSHYILASTLAELVREGQAQGIFKSEYEPEDVGALIATYFFRLCLLQFTAKAAPRFAWEDQMRKGLAVIYGGLATSVCLEF